MRIELEMGKAMACKDISTMVSLVAVLISLAALLVNVFQNKHNRRYTLEASILKDIFDELLQDKIPSAIDKLRYDQGKAIEIDGATTELNILLDKAKYFAYSDARFYSKLKDMVEKIEDELVEAGNKSYTEHTYKLFDEKVKKDTSKLYIIIRRRYYGIC